MKSYPSIYRCELTIEHCDQPMSDVIMFHLPSIQLHDVPGHADPRQVLAVETLESPEDRRLLPARLLLGGKRELDGLFNWTINYKYGFFLEISGANLVKIFDRRPQEIMTTDIELHLPQKIYGTFYYKKKILKLEYLKQIRSQKFIVGKNFSGNKL